MGWANQPPKTPQHQVLCRVLNQVFCRVLQRMLRRVLHQLLVVCVTCHLQLCTHPGQTPLGSSARYCWRVFLLACSMIVLAPFTGRCMVLLGVSQAIGRLTLCLFPVSVTYCPQLDHSPGGLQRPAHYNTAGRAPWEGSNICDGTTTMASPSGHHPCFSPSPHC